MNKVYISNFASTLGSKNQSVEQAETAGQLISSAAALREAGFDRHQICSDNENSYHLASRAFSQSNIDPQSIDVIVYATCLPMNGSQSNHVLFEESGDVKHVMRFPASELQAEYEMHNAFIIGLNQQACTGMLGSLRIARNFLLAENGVNNVLCVTSDRFPKGAKYEQAYNLISDGAAVCRVSRDAQGFRLLDVHHISNGAMVDASDDETVGSYFNYVVRLIGETLDKNHLAMSSVRWVVPQNTNRKAWEVLSRLLDLDVDQAFFPSMKQTGHVISADNIINLAELRSSSHLEEGDLVLTFMAGYGSNWQCALLEAV